MLLPRRGKEKAFLDFGSECPRGLVVAVFPELVYITYIIEH